MDVAAATWARAAVQSVEATACGPDPAAAALVVAAVAVAGAVEGAAGVVPFVTSARIEALGEYETQNLEDAISLTS
jgi:hypothetical protein